MTAFWMKGGMSAETLQRVEALSKERPFFDVYPKMIEVQYTGRDTSRVVVRALRQLARIVGQADGEVQCERSGDVDQHWFEFFTIQEGRLFCQRGDIVRQPKEEVLLE
jgi:hypothetical protein